MTDFYLDTSVLAKLYYPEPESQRVQAWVGRYRRALPYTSLHQLELNNALALKQFRGEIDAAQVRQCQAAVEADLESGALFRPVLDWAEIFTVATRLANRYTAQVGARSLDVLHIAAAGAASCGGFFTNDPRQAQLAQRATLTVESL